MIRAITARVAGVRRSSGIGEDLTMDRQDVTFSSSGTRCAGWLYRPDGDGPHPLVVMAHGFSATRELRLDAYAGRFRIAGIGALLFDYRHFGASDGEPRQLVHIPSQLADYHAAIAYARTVDWADPDRIAVFGSSFSGGHVIEVAAADPRIAASISQCPFTDGRVSAGTLGIKNLSRAIVASIRDQSGALLGREPHYIPAVGAPDSLAIMTTPDAQPGFAALTPPETLWENRVAARVLLHIIRYRPGRAAARLSHPALFCVCDRDSLAPAQTTLKYAATAPRGEIKRYPVGHFEIYVGDAWEQAVTDQTEFLTRCLGLSLSEQPEVPSA
jgi:dienelactone hydrolase